MWSVQMVRFGNTMTRSGVNLNTALELSALKKDYRLMSNDNDHNISFEEFQELCSEAGISSDNPEQMEADFRSGRALADVTDALITDQELNPTAMPHDARLNELDIALVQMDENVNTETNKRAAIKLAVNAIRYLAECCHDEGQN